MTIAAAGLIALLSLLPRLPAQEYRATLLGGVTDTSGAVVPGAKVIATNLDTDARAAAKTNNEGHYVIPFLLPGTYRLRVEHEGFKSVERSPIELRVNDRTRVDVVLEVGQVSDRVTVTAEAPLLETASGDRGQVVDNRSITDLPVEGRNPFTLMNLAAGVQYTGDLKYTRPFDNGAIADFSINGGRSGINEYQIDGLSNNANTGRNNLSYVPPVEATQQFKVQTNTYDAQYGRTGGGVISLAIKPGTNNLHGAVYEYLRRKELDANPFGNNASGVPRPERVLDQYGFEIDGPVTIPGVYNGRNRTFFMFALERYRESLPLPSIGAVPTKEQRDGDFSATYRSNGQLYTIYDPTTNQRNPAYNPSRPVSVTNSAYVRQPFPGNRVPKNVMEPIALRVLRDIPLPNQPGDPVTHLNNWYANAYTQNDFQNLIGRIDHALGDSWRFYSRANHAYRDGGRANYNGWDTPAANKVHGGRFYDGLVLDAVGTLTARTVLTLRAGFNRYKEIRKYTPQDISDLGFPRTFVGQLQMPDHYPVFTFSDYLQAGRAEDLGYIVSDTYSAQAGISHFRGAHSFKAGTEYRLMRYANQAATNGSGTFAFTRLATGASPDIDNTATGNSIASFLLGYMASATATINATPYLSWGYPVVYVQDSWQVRRRLTFSYGLRWDYESPAVERYNRQNRGFDYKAKSPFQVPGLDVRGGLLFAGNGGLPRGAFDPDLNNWQPRVGVAMKVLKSKPLVLRAGAGRYFLPTTEFGGNTGFSQSTNAEVVSASFGAFRLLSNPFPDGLMKPPAASQGLATQAGDAISFSDPARTIPYVWQYSAGFQYELRPGLLIEASYSGSQTREVQVSKSINVLTAEQLALGTSVLNHAVPNPFYGVLPASSARGSVVNTQVRTLMLPYPQFTTMTRSNSSLGKSWYNALQLKLERRFKNGFSVLASFTASKTMEAVAYLNPQDTRLSRELTSFDVPKRVVISGVYELPAGPRKPWANSGWKARIIGNWQLNWSTVIQDGPPISYPDYYLRGDPRIENQSLSKWFNTSTDLWQQRPVDTLRTTPLRSPNIRRHSAPQVNANVFRSIRIREGHKLQIKVSAFNLTNTPIFGFPNVTPSSPLFGVVPVTQINNSRSVELGFRYSF